MAPVLGYTDSKLNLLRPALSSCIIIILSSSIASLGGNGLINPPCPKSAVVMTDKQLQLHPDPQALVPLISLYIIIYNLYIYTSIKNNCLMKSEVGMVVLKSKQTRVWYRDNHHICIVHPYTCFSRQIM